MNKYKILIKNPNNSGYTFAMEKKDVLEEIIAKDENGNDVKAFKPTGKFTLIPFEREAFEDVRIKYLDLLETYRPNELNVINDCTEMVTVTVELENDEVENEEPEDNVEEPTE